MKMAMTALAPLLLAGVFLAGAAPATAGQDNGDRHQRDDGPSRAERNVDRPHTEGENRYGGAPRETAAPRDGGQRGGGQRDWGQRDGGGPRSQEPAPQAPVAARTPEAPRAPEARATRDGDHRDRGGRVYGDSVGRPGPWTAGAQGLNDGSRNRGGDDRQADHRDGSRGADNRDRNDGRGRYDGDRRDGDRHDGDRRDRNRYDGDRHDGDRRDGARRDGDRNGDRGHWDRRDWDRDRDRSHNRWERGRYPSVYFSSHRYRYAWRPPAGYYARIWSFGDFLPNGWYGTEYFISDPWNFDLPLAPPGYDWVRVGEDALLIDRYTGRVLQVVRDVFW